MQTTLQVFSLSALVALAGCGPNPKTADTLIEVLIKTVEKIDSQLAKSESVAKETKPLTLR